MKVKSIKVKKFLLLLASTLMIQSGTVNASGIPTVDVAAIAQMVQQLMQLQQMYSQLQQQYNTAVNTLNNFTGSRGLGMIQYDLNLRQFIPSNYRSVLASIATSGKGALSDKGRQLYDSLNLQANCVDKKGEALAICEKRQANFAQTQAFLQEAEEKVQQRLTKVEGLMQEINNTTDAKAIADLQARIQAETALLDVSKQVAAYQRDQLYGQALKQDQQIQQERHQKRWKGLTEAEIENQLTWKR